MSDPTGILPCVKMCSLHIFMNRENDAAALEQSHLVKFETVFDELLWELPSGTMGAPTGSSIQKFNYS